MSVTVRIGGGLGNQMFQYAFGRALEIKAKRKVIYDISSFVGQKDRKFELLNYNVQGKFCEKPFHLPPYFKFLPLAVFSSKKRKLLREAALARLWIDINKDNFKYYPELLEKDNVYISGCFFNKQYYENIFSIFFNEFKLITPLTVPNKNLLEQIQATNSVSLHVRRTDYLTFLQEEEILTKEYYDVAVNYIATKLNLPIHLYIFSDDITWVKSNFNFTHDTTYVDINDNAHGYFDLELMRSCKHNILANSTFSWWAGMLNCSPGKIIIYPVAESGVIFQKKYIDEFVPSTWIQASYRGSKVHISIL